MLNFSAKKGLFVPITCLVEKEFECSYLLFIFLQELKSILYGKYMRESIGQLIYWLSWKFMIFLFQFFIRIGEGLSERDSQRETFLEFVSRVYQNAWKSKFQGGGLPKYVVLPN